MTKKTKSRQSLMVGLVVLALALCACGNVQCAAGAGQDVQIHQQQGDSGEDLLIIVMVGLAVCFALAGLASGLGGMGGGQ